MYIYTLRHRKVYTPTVRVRVPGVRCCCCGEEIKEGKRTQVKRLQHNKTKTTSAGTLQRKRNLALAEQKLMRSSVLYSTNFIYTYTYLHVYISTYTHISYIHIYIYIYTSMYTYTY